MYLIAGLGNPGREYAESRHNAGFAFIEELAGRCGVRPIAKEHLALTALGRIGGQDVILAMPQTVEPSISSSRMSQARLR